MNSTALRDVFLTLASPDETRQAESFNEEPATGLLNRERLYWMDVEFAVRIVDCDQTSRIDSQAAGKPFRDENVEVFPLNF